MDGFPLYVLLTIYLKAERECYINYMQGFKALVSWLGPIDAGISSDFIRDYPSILTSYEIQEIASILKLEQNQIIHTILNQVSL